MLRRILIIMLFAMLFRVSAAASDIDGHWSEKYISGLAAQDILSGDGEGNFMPDRNITRAEFVCAAVRIIGEGYGNITAGFSDVNDADFYAPYIYRAAELGIVTGFADGTFRPSSSITREEAMVILSRTCGFLSGYSIPDIYTDLSEITPAAKSAFAYACRKGVISGYPDMTLRPRGELKRAEAAVMLTNAMGIEAGEPGFMVGYPRLAQSGIYGCIRVEICTNMPCTVYYTLHNPDTHGTPAVSAINRPLAITSGGASQISADIVCDIGKAYDVFLIAVTPGGRSSRIVKIENTSALPFTEGDGTNEKPYGIYNEMQLAAIRYFPNCSYVVKSDIELSGQWTPIDAFSGEMDGAGHRISGLLISSGAEYCGLFRSINRGRIKNLTVDGRVSAKRNAGIFAGELTGGELYGCVATGYVTAETNNAGAFVGENAGVIDNCLSAAYIVEASAFAGGITGQNYGTIRKSVSAVHTVSADMYAGGVASVNVGGKIQNSVSACFNVFDMMMSNCGRVTTNKSSGVTKANYAYDGMKTTAEKDINSEDNSNGADIGWDVLTDRKRLCELLNCEERNWSGGGNDERYLLPYPSKAAAPVLIPGISAYAPIRVGDAAELLGIIDNPNMHFLLIKDIYFPDNMPWTTPKAGTDGFSGTLDGGGHTITNLRILPNEDGNCGMLGIISDGTVRDLKLKGVKITSGRTMGVIAAENGGSIIGCEIDAQLQPDETAGVYAGIAAGYNYGTIRDVIAGGSISTGSKNSVIGGIAAHNEGFIDDVLFRGSIAASKTDTLGEAVGGGICGYNAGEGMVYNSFASVNLRLQATTAYAGGVCGILSGGELYKGASAGLVITEPPKLTEAVSYTGGIAGLCAEGIVMHAYSIADISSYTTKSFTGGVCGYVESATVQNVYAANSVIQTADKIVGERMVAYSGGVCGYNESGTIAGAAAVNREVRSMVNTGRICGGGDSEQLFSNYASADMRISEKGENKLAGDALPLSRFYEQGFFTKPLAEGGIMGWLGDVWSEKIAVHGALPVLKDVKGQ